MHRLPFSVTPILSLVLACTAAAQTIDGRVLDLEGSSIFGATISFRLESGELVARVVSNEDGDFQIQGIDPGTYAVWAERLGFQTTQSFLSLLEGDSIGLELRMDEEAIPLDPITVIASPRPGWEHLQPPALWEFWERKDHYGRLGTGDFLTYEELKPLHGSPVAIAVTQLVPYIHAVANEDRRNIFHIQGRMGCPPLIFLDGHPLAGEGGLRPASGMGSRFMKGVVPIGEEPTYGPLIDDWISLDQVEAVEVGRMVWM